MVWRICSVKRNCISDCDATTWYFHMVFHQSQRNWNFLTTVRLVTFETFDQIDEDQPKDNERQRQWQRWWQRNLENILKWWYCPETSDLWDNRSELWGDMTCPTKRVTLDSIHNSCDVFRNIKYLKLNPVTPNPMSMALNRGDLFINLFCNPNHNLGFTDF